MGNLYTLGEIIDLLDYGMEAVDEHSGYRIGADKNRNLFWNNIDCYTHNNYTFTFYKEDNIPLKRWKIVNKM